MGAASDSVRGSGGDATRQRLVATIRKRDADLARLREDHARKIAEEAEAEKRAASANAERTRMRTELRHITERLRKQDAEVQLLRDAIATRTADAEEARRAAARATADAARAIQAGNRMRHTADAATRRARTAGEARRARSTLAKLTGRGADTQGPASSGVRTCHACAM